ncbi:MAG: methyltransferase domain-containing protein [Pseudomonadota bacterium]
MADPFQDVDAAGADFIAVFAESMEMRQSDPTMERIVADYLAQLDFGEDTLTVEIGAGAGAIARRIAARAAPARVMGYEPSAGFVAEAKTRAEGVGNLHFEQADGAALPLDAGVADHAILHTVLTHVTAPEALIAEARRVLKPGGTLVVCDCDFSKAALSSFPDDPLDACARAFVREFVTDPDLVAKLRALLIAAGFEIRHFTVTARTVTEGEKLLPWVVETTKLMVARGDIGAALAEALIAEMHDRTARGRFYGFQPFATAIAARA